MVGVVILNYNNAVYTLDCVESIRRFNTAPVRIVVVDNASTDNSVETLKKWQGKHSNVFEMLISSENGGYARGNNLGLKYLEKDKEVTEVMVLNNDVLFTQNIIPTLSEFVYSHPEAGIVSPLLRCPDGVTPDSTCARKDCTIREIIWTYLLYFTNRFGILSHFSEKRKMLKTNPELLQQPSVEIELPSGSCMLISKQLFKEIGYFDPNTFLYYEENILYQKLKAVGKKNYMLPGVSCIHLGGVTTNKVAHNASYMKSSKASGYYYATHYRDLDYIQRSILKLSFLWFGMMVNVVKTIKRWIR